MALDISTIITTSKKDDKSFGILKNVMASIPLESFQPPARVLKDFETVSLGRDVTPQDQYSSGRCWIFAAMNILRRRIILTKTDLPPSFNLSHSFIYFYSLLEKCNKVLELSYVLIKKRKIPIDSYKFYDIAGTHIRDGGSFDMFIALLEKYGIVPLEIYPDTFQSRHSHRLLDLLSLLVKQAVILISKDEDFDTVKKMTLQKVFDVLSIFLGVPPKSFTYDWPSTNGFKKFVRGGESATTMKDSNNNKISPLSFYKKYISKHMNKNSMITISNDPRRKSFQWLAPYNSCEVIPSQKVNINNIDNHVFELSYNITNLDDIKRAIIRSLKNKKAVLISGDVDRFFNQHNNLMAYEASSIPRLFDIDIWNMDKADTLEAHITRNNHIMTIIGYDKKNNIWEIENSWGNSSPITMSGEWFDRFSIQYIIEKKFLDKEIQSKIKESHIPTKPNVDLWFN
jgi:bleomycin hydrolase